MSTRTRVRNYLKKERIHYWRKVKLITTVSSDQ